MKKAFPPLPLLLEIQCEIKLVLSYFPRQAMNDALTDARVSQINLQILSKLIYKCSILQCRNATCRIIHNFLNDQFQIGQITFDLRIKMQKSK